MGQKLTLLLGGASSGKNSYAQQLAHANGGSVLFEATVEAGDAEMQARIQVHRAERPANWQTLEAPLNVAAALSKEAVSAVVLLDCLTLLASYVIPALPEPVDNEAAEEALLTEVDALLGSHEHSAAHWIVISNELGLVPPYPLGRIYRDALGHANQRVAAAADEVLFMVAGLPMRVKG